MCRSFGEYISLAIMSPHISQKNSSLRERTTANYAVMVPGNQRCLIISQQESHVGMFEATPQTPPLNSNNLTLLQNILPVQIYETKTAFFCPQLCVFLVFTEGLQRCQQGYYSRWSTCSGAESAVVHRQRQENFILFVGVPSSCHLFCPGHISFDNIINLGNLLSSSCHSSFRMRKI